MKGLFKVAIVDRPATGYAVLHKETAVEDCFYILGPALRNWDMKGDPENYKATELLLPMEFL